MTMLSEKRDAPIEMPEYGVEVLRVDEEVQVHENRERGKIQGQARLQQRAGQRGGLDAPHEERDDRRAHNPGDRPLDHGKRSAGARDERGALPGDFRGRVPIRMYGPVP